MVSVAVLACDLLGHGAERLVDRPLVFEAVIQNEHHDFSRLCRLARSLISAAGDDCLLPVDESCNGVARRSRYWLMALGAVVRMSVPRASSAARRLARCEMSPSILACIFQAMRLTSHCLLRVLVGSPHVSSNFSRSCPTVMRWSRATSLSMSICIDFSQKYGLTGR